METEDVVYDIPADIPPPLEYSAELLKSIIQIAASSPRNTQKMLHLVSRGIEILQALRTPFSEPTSDFYEMITAMESVRKLELILMEARSLIEQEATLPAAYIEESKTTWGVRRDRLQELLIETHAPEFNPPRDWEADLEEVTRVDDHLWVGLIAHDMWNSGSGLELAQEAERTAAKLLESPISQKEASSRKRDIENIMRSWGHKRRETESSRPSFDVSMPSFGSFRSGPRTSRSNSPVLTPTSSEGEPGPSFPLAALRPRPQISPLSLSNLKKAFVKRFASDRESVKTRDTTTQLGEPEAETLPAVIGVTKETPVLSPSTAERISSSERQDELVLDCARPEESASWIRPSNHDLLAQFRLEGTLSQTTRIGSGGLGEVLRGVWKRPDNEPIPVAIRNFRYVLTRQDPIPSEDSVPMQAIILECIIRKVAQHPNILLFYGYQILDGEVGLVHPWCENGSLDKYIVKHGNLKDTDKLKLLCDTARGLAYLHTLSPPIVHGNIKPQNVIITDELKAVLYSFELSKVMTNPPIECEALNGRGTLPYMAPELLADEEALKTNMSDVYAFGGLILATMSGKPPFYQISSAIPLKLVGKTPKPADYSELGEHDPLWNLMERCWSYQPTDRPSAVEVVRTLEDEIQHRSEMEGDAGRS